MVNGSGPPCITAGLARMSLLRRCILNCKLCPFVLGNCSSWRAHQTAGLDFWHHLLLRAGFLEALDLRLTRWSSLFWLQHYDNHDYHIHHSHYYLTCTNILNQHTPPCFNRQVSMRIQLARHEKDRYHFRLGSLLFFATNQIPRVWVSASQAEAV